jgi:DNA-3-methyladenine glycosylase I
MLKPHRRCAWAGRDLLHVAYHDHEWGVPQTNPTRLFEMLVLEGAQAGLSWITILRKRASYWRAFQSFDPQRVARFTPARIERLMVDPGIVRNRLKIEGTVRNARLFVTLAEETGDVAAWLWQFVGGIPKQNAWKTMSEVPVRTAESDAMSLALRKRGFTFVGTTICYAFMQATGMVNDHLTTCFRYKDITKTGRKRRQ